MTDSAVSSVTPAARPDFKKILANSAYPDPGLNAGQQQAFINRYSFGALVLQFVYYFAMGDAPLAWLSLFCSVIFIFSPLLVFLPIVARRRAYARRSWSTFGEFYHNQRKWDREAFYLTVATVILVGAILWIIGPMILSSVQNVTGQPSSGDITQQLQDTVQQYKDILGQ